MKIIDKVKKLESQDKVYFSFEYFPPKTDLGVSNLNDRLERMSLWGPLYVDITWGAGGSTAQRTQELATFWQNVVGMETQMHLTCTNMDVNTLTQAIDAAKSAGLQNLLCLRGDPPEGSEDWVATDQKFQYGVDLVRFVRARHGDYFGIAVAGYPEGHPDSSNYDQDLKHLKEKVDAGADLIITQFFYETEYFLKFVKDCRSIGITCPIVPGLLPIQSYGAFMRMVKFNSTKVPQRIYDDLNPIKEDDQAVKEYGVKLCIQQIQQIIVETGIKGFHFYTMNLEKSIFDILNQLNWLPAEPPRPDLPWTRSLAPQRSQEAVRPIHWASRPGSYLHRTGSWDNFPNGRWGDKASPAFGDYHGYLDSPQNRMTTQRATRLKKVYGEPKTVEEIAKLFAGYCKGEVSCLPFNDQPLQAETGKIQDALVKINLNLFLTTNSQPAVNGAPSDDVMVGWGEPNGFVYQKGYVEFFTPPAQLKKLLAVLPRFPFLQLMATNVKGETEGNCNTAMTTAVTWGVFPHSEIKQPTVQDFEAFMMWKDEAFHLWLSQWQVLYDADSAATTRDLLQSIHDEWYLVSIVDNNYISGNIFDVFDAAMASSAAAATTTTTTSTSE